MARSLNEITNELFLALNAHGFDSDEASNAISDALVQCLPSYQAMLTLAIEAARQAHDARFDSRHDATPAPHFEESEAGFDVTW